MPENPRAAKADNAEPEAGAPVPQPDARGAARADREAEPEELLGFDGWFEFWAHQGQLPPSGEGWRVWLMMAGRGFGKTRAGAEWIHGWR